MPLPLNAAASPLDEHRIAALQTALDGLSPLQLAWVSGYLAGLSHLDAPAAAKPRAEPAVTVLYGSQTGNAKAVAETLGERARARGLQARVLAMSDLSPRALAKERWLLLVVSTHGDGEPPENAYALHAHLAEERAPRLEQLRYAVLGLGDSSYEHFCKCAADFDRRLAELGARPLQPLQCCDLDFAGVAEAWSASVVEQVQQAQRAESDAEGAAEPRLGNVVALRPQRPAHDRNHPYSAALLENRRITTADAVADVRHIVLQTDGAALRYRPGDALGVRFCNDPALVDRLLSRLALDGEATVTVAGDALPLRTALTERLELTQLHPATVRAWAGHSTAAALQDLLADEPRLRAFAAEHQLIDLIERFPAEVDAATLAALARPLQPRLYSIASCPDTDEDEVHLTVSVLRYQANGRDCLGGASGYLAERLDRDATLPVYVAENTAFRLPEDGDTPLILIGAGTGVAPYRAFLRHRAGSGARGRNWLFFGNRHFHRDFLYQLDWQAQRKAGLLARTSLAFSRDGATNRYVQDRLREESAELYRWLQDGAHLYVCGGTQMGQGVHAALLDVVAAEGALTSDGAAEYIDNLRRQARYHRDLY